MKIGLGEVALIGGLLYSIYAYVQGRSTAETQADLLAIPKLTTGLIAKAPEYFHEVGTQIQPAVEWTQEWISQVLERGASE